VKAKEECGGTFQIYFAFSAASGTGMEKGDQLGCDKNKKAAPPWMAAENLLASFFYFISVCSEMGSPPHMRGELRR